jgi:hypothetical protein
MRRFLQEMMSRCVYGGSRMIFWGGEDDRFSQARANAVGSILLYEEPLQPGYGDVRLDIRRVSSLSGNIDGLLFRIRGEDLELDLPGPAQIFQIFLEHDGHGVGLLSR